MEELDKRPIMRARLVELEKIVAAIDDVYSSKSWQTLTESVFEPALKALERQLLNQARENEPDSKALIRLNAQQISLSKYTNLNELSKWFQLELKGIRDKLKE